MKLLLLYGALLAVPTMAEVPVPVVVSSVNKPLKATKIAVYFTNHNTFSDLAAIRQSLLEKDGILLDYEKLVFTPVGDLQSITFHVDCRDGFQGSYIAENLSATPNIGFYRDYTDKAKTPFLIGKIF